MNLEESILSTLAYHDIFDYPLHIEEVNKYLINNKSNLQKIKKTINALARRNKVGEVRGLFYLKSRKNTVLIRRKRMNISKKKHKKAAFYLWLLKLIPSVKFVAISGALAMDNSTENDDIDFLIISSKKTLWTTRLLSNLILLPFKRKPTSKKQKDKACLNIFIDEQDLKIQDQNLYSAHELAQLKPLYTRKNEYLKLIKANNWVYKYLPNWSPHAVNEKDNRDLLQRLANFLLIPLYMRPIENTLKWIQLRYMKSKITSEKIGNLQLFFHPSQTQQEILRKYKFKTKKL